MIFKFYEAAFQSNNFLTQQKGGEKCFTFQGTRRGFARNNPREATDCPDYCLECPTVDVLPG